MNISNKLKYLIEQSDMSLADISTKTNLTRSYISQLKNGHKTNPTKSVLDSLAEAFKIPVAYFYSNQEDADDLQLIATRARVMDPASRQAILDFMDAIEKAYEENE